MYCGTLPRPLTQYGVVYGAVVSVVWVGGLGSMDDPRWQVLRQADKEGRLHELWRVVIVIQHRAKHCGRTRKRPHAAVTTLDWGGEILGESVGIAKEWEWRG